MKRIASVVLGVAFTCVMVQTPALAFNGCIVGPALVVDRPATCGYTAHGQGAYEAAGGDWCVTVKRSAHPGSPAQTIASFCSRDGARPAGALDTIEGDEVYATLYPAICQPTQFGTCYDAGSVAAEDLR